MKQETFDAIRIIISWLGAFSFAYFMWYCYRNIDKNKTDIDKNKTDIDNRIEHLGSCLKDLSVYSATTTRILVAYLNSFKLETDAQVNLIGALYNAQINFDDLAKIGLNEDNLNILRSMYYADQSEKHANKVFKDENKEVDKEVKPDSFIPENKPENNNIDESKSVE